MPALTLSVLLSIDTLKTCVVVDALTRTRHDSNREMIGQGLANLASAARRRDARRRAPPGATLVNIASGAADAPLGRDRRRAGAGRLPRPRPLRGLGADRRRWPAILIVVAYRMFDWGSLRLLRQRSTVLDFVVVASVIAVAVSVGLIRPPASASRSRSCSSSATRCAAP